MEAWGSIFPEEDEPQAWCDKKSEGPGLRNQLVKSESVASLSWSVNRVIYIVYSLML